jgi:hypothetical protein
MVEGWLITLVEIEAQVFAKCFELNASNSLNG